jgi:hypothetical protein
VQQSPARLRHAGGNGAADTGYRSASDCVRRCCASGACRLRPRAGRLPAWERLCGRRRAVARHLPLLWPSGAHGSSRRRRGVGSCGDSRMSDRVAVRHRRRGAALAGACRHDGRSGLCAAARAVLITRRTDDDTDGRKSLPERAKGAPYGTPFATKKPGGDLLSQGVCPQVPSARAGLTAVFGMGTGVSPPPWPPGVLSVSGASENSIASTNVFDEMRVRSSPRPISTGRLNTSPCVHLRPINLVVYQGPYPLDAVGDLISERVSRLDAFSAYLFRRSQTSRAPGGTTGTRELRPSRSSRTRDSSPQISYAHGG